MKTNFNLLLNKNYIFLFFFIFQACSKAGNVNGHMNSISNTNSLSNNNITMNNNFQENYDEKNNINNTSKHKSIALELENVKLLKKFRYNSNIEYLILDNWIRNYSDININFRNIKNIISKFHSFNQYSCVNKCYTKNYNYIELCFCCNQPNIPISDFKNFTNYQYSKVSLKHTDEIKSILYFGNDVIVTGSVDGEIKLWSNSLVKNKFILNDTIKIDDSSSYPRIWLEMLSKVSEDTMFYINSIGGIRSFKLNFSKNKFETRPISFVESKFNNGEQNDNKSSYDNKISYSEIINLDFKIRFLKMISNNILLCCNSGIGYRVLRLQFQKNNNLKILYDKLRGTDTSSSINYVLRLDPDHFIIFYANKIIRLSNVFSPNINTPGNYVDHLFEYTYEITSAANINKRIICFSPKFGFGIFKVNLADNSYPLKFVKGFKIDFKEPCKAITMMSNRLFTIIDQNDLVTIYKFNDHNNENNIKEYTKFELFKEFDNRDILDSDYKKSSSIVAGNYFRQLCVSLYNKIYLYDITK